MHVYSSKTSHHNTTRWHIPLIFFESHNLIICCHVFETQSSKGSMASRNHLYCLICTNFQSQPRNVKISSLKLKQHCHVHYVLEKQNFWKSIQSIQGRHLCFPQLNQYNIHLETIYISFINVWFSSCKRWHNIILQIPSYCLCLGS